MIRSGVLAALMCLVINAQAQAEGLRFPVQSWSGDLLDLIVRGPSHLPADLETGIAEPDASHSDETGADLALLHELAALGRSEDVVRRIHLENDPDVSPADLFFQEGLLAPRTEMPAAWSLIDLVAAEARWFILRDKWRHQRARPSAVDPTLSTVIDVPPHASYPSGHSGEAHAAAFALSLANPACADQYLAHAFAVAHRREIAGVHYRSDTMAGITVAGTVITALEDLGLIDTLVMHAREEFATNLPDFSCP